MQLFYVGMPGGKIGYPVLYSGAPIPGRECSRVWRDDNLLGISFGDLLDLSFVQQPRKPGEDPGDIFLPTQLADGVEDDVFIEQHVADDHLAVKS